MKIEDLDIMYHKYNKATNYFYIPYAIEINALLRGVQGN